MLTRRGRSELRWRTLDALAGLRVWIVDLSEAAHRPCFPHLGVMSFCAHAGWRKDVRGWRLFSALVNPVWRHVLRGKRDHTDDAFRRWVARYDPPAPDPDYCEYLAPPPRRRD